MDLSDTKESTPAVKKSPTRGRLRIGFVVARYPSQSETFVSRKVDFLREQGHEVVIFTTTSSELKKLKQRDSDPVIINLHGNGPGRIRNCLSILPRATVRPQPLRSRGRLFALAMRNRYPVGSRLQRLLNYLTVAQYRIDILHVHFAGNLQSLLGVKEALGLPVVVSLLGSDVTSSEEYGFPAFLGLVPQESDALIASCKYVGDEFHRRTQSTAPIHILPPEVPSSFFKMDRKYSGTQCRLLTVARLHWKKGLLYALHTARELKSRGVVFHYDIIGGGEERESLKKAVEDMGLQDTVDLHGPKDPREIPDYLRRADIVILPSVNEGAAGVLLEAQATGLPVISTNIGGISETVLDRKTGLLVPAREPGTMADAVEMLILDPALRHALGSAGRRHASQFDTQIIGSRLVTIYQAVLENRKQGMATASGACYRFDASSECENTCEPRVNAE